MANFFLSLTNFCVLWLFFSCMSYTHNKQTSAIIMEIPPYCVNVYGRLHHKTLLQWWFLFAPCGDLVVEESLRDYRILFWGLTKGVWGVCGVVWFSWSDGVGG